MKEKNMPNWYGLLIALPMAVWAKERNEMIKAEVKVDFFLTIEFPIVKRENVTDDKHKNVEF
jgi:hypothetical protein